MKILDNKRLAKEAELWESLKIIIETTPIKKCHK